MRRPSRLDPTPGGSRRRFLGGAMAAAALTTLHAAALDASPVPDGDEELLFVQIAESGAAEPISDQSGQFVLTLVNGSGQSLYFSDRPERLAGILTTSAFISDVASVAVRPNAALVFRAGGDDAAPRVAPMELSDPAFDRTTNEVSYLALILAIDGKETLTASDPSLAVDALPAEFDGATLFIDAINIYINGFVPGKHLHESVAIGRATP